MALLKTLVTLAITYTISAICTVPVSIAALIYFLRNPSRFRYVKPRPNQPDVLKRGYKHGYVTVQDGTIRIHYVEAGERHRPLLLLVHGFPEFWYSWHHQLREFQNDYHVVAVDLRGYGESSKPTSVSDYAVPKLVEDLRQTVIALGKSRCTVVAHDWGGILAWRLALTYPDLVEKLIVMNCPHPKAVQNLSLPTKLKQALKTWYMFFFQCPYLPEMLLRANDMQLLVTMLKTPPGGCMNPNALTDEDVEAWKYTFQQPGAFTPPIHYYRSFRGRPPPKQHIGPAEHNVGSKKSPPGDIVQPPTLVVWSTGDIVLGPELAHSSLQFCQNGSLRMLDASHWTQFDKPELCNQAIREFLRS